MPYPEDHLLLSIHWIHEAYPLESGQTGIRFHSTGAGALDVTQAKVDACAQSVKSFWNTVGAKVPLNYLIKFLRLARIDETGHYAQGTSSFDSVYAATGSAGAGGQNTAPLQTACVTTLLAAVPHGQASHGRLYLPPIATAVANSGLWTASDADARSAAIATMLTSLNTVLNGTAAIYSTGTLRSAAGLGRKVVEVTTGTRPDVQRRRAKGVPDVKGAHSTVVSAADPGQVLEGWI